MQGASKVSEWAAMTAGEAARMTCSLYQVLPSSSDELQLRLQAVLDPKEQTTRDYAYRRAGYQRCTRAGVKTCCCTLSLE